MHDALDHRPTHRRPYRLPPVRAACRNLRRLHHGEAADDWDTCARRG